jgi:hypothetical protein
MATVRIFGFISGEYNVGGTCSSRVTDPYEEKLEALCYKPEGHGFDSRIGHLILQLT